MKKQVSILIVSLASMILCRVYPIDFYHISEWGSYLFITPFCHSAFSLFLMRKKELSKKFPLYICCGAIVPILLSTDLANSFWIEKILLVAAGGALTVLLNSTSLK